MVLYAMVKSAGEQIQFETQDEGILFIVVIIGIARRQGTR
jgi:hypothetical protein